MTDPANDPIISALQERLGGQYAIESLLGQGGMGSVYRARDITLDRPVAIKVIAGDVAANAQLRERFLLEARTVAKLRHPNLVAVYSAGDAGGLLYFVMELVQGESLRDLLTREGKVEPARAELILHELALALDYAHANGIVHRDVKPENILLDGATGRALLTDFGVARALERDGGMTGTGMILGSPKYMSPEQASGEATIDGRSDLYALALVGYEMFTGKPVVDASNVAGMLVKHLTETPKPLADSAAAVPQGVAVAVDRALAKDRDARWATGREMAEAIGVGWTPGSGINTAAQRPATVSTLKARGRPKVRNRWMAGVALVAVAAVGAWFALSRDGVPRGVDPRRSMAVMPFEVLSSNADVRWLRDGAVNMLTLALAPWRDLTVTDYERTMVLVRDAGLEDKRVDLDRALEIARKAGVWTVVTGTITTTSDSLRIDARLYDVASGRSLQTESRGAPLNSDPRPLFDGLANYLIGVAGVTGSESVALAAATTNSLVAYRAYLDGVKALFSWRVRDADSLFQIAIANDSTFALAWHKRSLALGWADAAGPAYMESARRAVELADRLPARDRALVEGHYALSRGLRTTGGDSALTSLIRAQEIFRGVIADDSTVAEAWYGLGDALFHQPFNVQDIDVSSLRMTDALHAFHRTLALDSTFHLAYSHLIQMYQGFANTGSGVLLINDTAYVVRDSADAQRLGGVARMRALQADAQATGLSLTRAWARADRGAVQPVTMLIQGFLSAMQPDSAMQVLDSALARPELANSTLSATAGLYRFIADDPRGAPELLQTTRQNDAAAFRRMVSTDRVGILATAMSAAGATGSAAEVARIADLFSRTDSIVPFAGIPLLPFLNGAKAALGVAMRGSVRPEDRVVLRRTFEAVNKLTPDNARQFSGAAAPFAYVAWMITGDTALGNAATRLSSAQAPGVEMRARDALNRGDTTAARTIAATFTSGDSVRLSRLGLAGMRTVVRAEVLAALGDTRGAIAQYEALHPSRFATAFVDPGYAVYVRSFAARARLYEEIGERDKAIASWEEFLRRWADGDAITEPARAEARGALQRLRDGARTVGTPS